MDDKQEYRDRVVLITGGGHGIGRGITEAFLQAGAKVLICGRNKPDNLPTVAKLSAEFYQADVRDAKQCQGLIDHVEQRWARLDVLVNNAGGSPITLSAQNSANFSEKIVALNLLAPFYCAQYANNIMQKQADGGNIINISSVSAVRPSPGTAIYGAAKAGLVNLCTSLAIEWAPKVRINSIIAGLIRTEKAELHYGGAAGIKATEAGIPMGRMGVPQDIAEACLFLASKRADWVSGTAFMVHGGGEPLPPTSYTALLQSIK